MSFLICLNYPAREKLFWAWLNLQKYPRMIHPTKSCLEIYGNIYKTEELAPRMVKKYLSSKATDQWFRESFWLGTSDHHGKSSLIGATLVKAHHMIVVEVDVNSYLHGLQIFLLVFYLKY